MTAVQKQPQAHIDDELINLPPLTTFSEKLFVDTPFGEFIIESAMNGNWLRCIIGCSCPFNKPGKSLTFLHESLNRISQTKMPETSLEATKFYKNSTIYTYIHRDEFGKADYCCLVYADGAETVH